MSKDGQNNGSNTALKQKATIMDQLKSTEVNEESTGGKNPAKSTLLILLEGLDRPLGTDPEFEKKREPTKKEIVELLARALGRCRKDDVSDLYDLRLGVRVDEGWQVVDRISYDSIEPECVQYLGDAIFLIGLESDDEEFLGELEDSVENPAHPAEDLIHPVYRIYDILFGLGIQHTNLETALSEVKWKASRCTQYYNFQTNSKPVVHLIMDAVGDKFNGVRKDILAPSGEYEQRHVLEKDVEVKNPLEDVDPPTCWYDLYVEHYDEIIATARAEEAEAINDKGFIHQITLSEEGEVGVSYREAGGLEYMDSNFYNGNPVDFTRDGDAIVLMELCYADPYDYLYESFEHLLDMTGREKDMEKLVAECESSDDVLQYASENGYYEDVKSVWDDFVKECTDIEIERRLDSLDEYIQEFDEHQKEYYYLNIY